MFYLVALELVCSFMVQFERTEGGQLLVTPYLTKDRPFEGTLFCLESLSRIDSEQHPEEIIGIFETGQLKRIVGFPKEFYETTYPTESDETNIPMESDESNIPMESDEINCPMEADEINIPMESDEKNIPMESDEINCPMESDETT
ncbi:hypothetical protein TNCV_5132341 [Trichonephila clavipes]|nr:hypothetical protein TNCV_5132341 [Trichonephila clavipes]